MKRSVIPQAVCTSISSKVLMRREFDYSAVRVVCSVYRSRSRVCFVMMVTVFLFLAGVIGCDLCVSRVRFVGC